MIFSIRLAQIFSESWSTNELWIWTNSSTSACKLTFDWRNWMLDQFSRHQLLKSLALLLASQQRSLLRSQLQSLHERNSEYQTSILLERSCLRKNSASNARSQNIEHVTVLNQLRCTKSQRIWKTICLRQSNDWERHAHILLHQYARWLIWFQVVYCWHHLE
jgi:hypothetical protein